MAKRQFKYVTDNSSHIIYVKSNDRYSIALVVEDYDSIDPEELYHMKVWLVQQIAANKNIFLNDDKINSRIVNDKYKDIGSNNRMIILDFIRFYIENFHYSPSIREICEGVGLTSTSTVFEHVNKLIKAGLLTKNPHSPRTMRLTDKGFEKLERLTNETLSNK